MRTCALLRVTAMMTFRVRFVRLRMIEDPRPRSLCGGPPGRCRPVNRLLGSLSSNSTVEDDTLRVVYETLISELLKADH